MAMLSWLRELLAGVGGRQGVAPLHTSQFKPGQVWNYRTRPQEPGSQVLIGRLEVLHGTQAVVHVYLRGLSLHNPAVEGGISSVVQHLPVSEEALSRSVVALAGTDEVPEGFEDGYSTWRLTFDQGKAGVFTGALAEIVAMMEGALGGSK